MFAVIHIPNFALQAVWRNDPSWEKQPVALTDGESTKAAVFQVNPLAESFGVAPGLTASQAMARCGHLQIRDRSLTQEQTATDILWQTANQFSANIEATGLGVCTLALQGLGLGDDSARRRWAQSILRMLTAVQLQGQAGFGVTPELARLAALVAKPVLTVQDPLEFIAGLPIGLLEPSANMLNILRLWGLRTMGELMVLGRDNLAERLGEEVLELFERVSINAVRPLRVISPPAGFREQICFENTVETIEPLLNILRCFIERLTGRLNLVQLVTTELELELRLDSGEKIQRAFKLPALTNDGEILLRTLRTYLEALKTGSPVVFLSLLIKPAQFQGHQFGLFETTLRNPNQFFETFARLQALGHSGKVGVPLPEPTHRPDSFRMNTPDFDAPFYGSEPDAEKITPTLRRYRPVVPAVIHFTGQKPAAIHCRNFSERIIQMTGPFLSSGNWWDDSRWSREEWDVQTIQGAYYRLFRSGDGDFVEGIYD